MLIRTIFRTIRSNNVLSIRHSSSTFPGMNVAPPLPNFSDDGKEYDPRRESLESFLNLRFGQNFPTINDDKNPQRDLVNFPRPVQPDFAEPTRLGIFPESWFKAFNEKTGVTGPYVFFGTFGTFLLSKEWLVFEHELLVGLEATIIILACVKMFGPKFRQYICSGIDENLKRWDDWQQGMIQFLNDYIEHEKSVRDAPERQSVLFDAKRENVKLQLEAEYRNRQMKAYQEVKRRLDFLVAKEEAENQFQQKHMVAWIIENVSKSITQQQEKDALKLTFNNLRKLSASSPL